MYTIAEPMVSNLIDMPGKSVPSRENRTVGASHLGQNKLTAGVTTLIVCQWRVRFFAGRLTWSRRSVTEVLWGDNTDTMLGIQVLTFNG